MAANSLAEAMEAGLRTLGLWNDAIVPTPGSKRVPSLNPRVLALMERGDAEGPPAPSNLGHASSMPAQEAVAVRVEARLPLRGAFKSATE